ncbi:MAG: TonB-dependent receptor [Pirellulales bacterium]|nr:TonB-dependent receptor [Pirellulales bacterium]
MSWFSWRKSHRWLGVAAGCLIGAASAFADDTSPSTRQTTELYGGAPLAKPAEEKVVQVADKVVNGASGAVPAQATTPAQMPTMAGSQDQPAAREYVYPSQGQFIYANNRLIRRQPQPGESEQPLAPVETPQSQVIPVSTIAGDLNFDFSNVNTDSRIGTPSPVAAEAVTGGSQPLFRNTKDAGSLLLDSPTSSNISLFRRPAASDPHIRGFHQRQIYTQLNGGQWVAARWDLDTIVSKIDSGVVEDVIVVKGPYSVLYGPGFSFIDVVTVPTPRFCCGPDYVARSVFNWQENGQGIYARQVIEGGGSYWGFRINAGFRTSNDYESGNDTLIRGSFKHRDIDFALGYDLTPDDRFEFNYVRLDLTDAEFYNQPTDIDFLVTNGFSTRFESDYGIMYDHYTAESWYNRTRLAQSGGTGFGGGSFIDAVFVDTYVDQISYGSRNAITWGDQECSHVTVGGDYRVIEQELLETDVFVVMGNPTAPANFDIPRSQSEGYGAFFQATDYIGPWTITTGSRVDFIDVDVDPLRSGLQFDDRRFDLWSGFATAEYQLNCEWSLLLGGGHAQRAPSFTELYADSPFIAGNQDGFNFFVGNDQLDKEELTQIDVGLLADYQNMQLAIRGFYGWVDNYITYTPPFVAMSNPITGYSFRNTDATLAGFDINGDYDLGGGLTAFGNLAYTEGRDTVINQPLYGIYPLQSRVGLRAETGRADCRGLGVEFSARIVENQDRLATSLDERATPGFTTYDLRSYWRVNPNLLLTSGILNLTDKNYFEHFDFRVSQAEGSPSFQPGRTVYLGGELTY